MSRQQQDTLEQQEREEMEQSKVYGAICAVVAEMSKDGIGKTNRNQQQGYNFRGIDDVYNALSPLLAKHKLCVLPRVTAHEIVERQTASGKPIFYTTVEMEFDFVSAEDGSKHTVGPMVGEAMDTADKSSNKAQSAAYKYACMQAFCIPTEGDNDADATTHEIASKPEGRDVTPARARIVRSVADACIAQHAKGDEWACFEEASGITDSEEKMLLWDYLKSHSKVRSSLKHHADLERQGQKATA